MFDTGIGDGLSWGMPDHSGMDGNIDTLIAQDNLEKLLEVKTLTFELRSQSDNLVEYLSRVPTLKRLLRLVFSVAEPNDLTDRAIDVFQNSENLRSVLPTLVNTPELLALPFECLARNVPHLTANPSDPLQPATLCQPFVYKGFNHLMNAIFWSSKRIPAVVSFLSENPRYLRAWAAHTVNQLVTDSLSSFILEYRERSDEINRGVAGLLVKSGMVDIFVNFLTNPDTTLVPFECVTSCATLLSQIIYKNVPGLAEHVIQRLPAVAEFVMTSTLHGSGILRLHHAADVLVCGLSSIIVTSVKLYHTSAKQLSGLSYEQLTHRSEELDHVIRKTEAPAAEKGKEKEKAGLSPTGIQEVDAHEKKYFPIFAKVLGWLNALPQRLTYMLSQAPQGALGVGAYHILDFVARTLAITADVRNALAKALHPESGVGSAWFGGVTSGTTVPAADVSDYALLSSNAQSGAGGNSSIDMLDTIQAGSVAIPLSVATLGRKYVLIGVPSLVLELFCRFPDHSNLHFIISRILLPLVEFGSACPEVSMALLTGTDLTARMNASVKEYVPFKARNSMLTYYSTFARAFLRIAVKLPDEAALEEKRRYVEAKNAPSGSGVLSTISTPQTVPALRRLLKDGHDSTNRELAEFLVHDANFVEFSRKFLEPEDDIPKSFGDARLTADYAAAMSKGKRPEPEATKFGSDDFGGGFGGFGDFSWGAPEAGAGAFGGFGGFGGQEAKGTGDFDFGFSGGGVEGGFGGFSW